MKNELYQVKRVLETILKHSISGITVDELKHQMGYAENDVKACLPLLIQMGSIRETDTRYFPTTELLIEASKIWLADQPI